MVFLFFHGILFNISKKLRGKNLILVFIYHLRYLLLFFFLQKVSRKLRLSKTKNTKFSDSGTLLPFYFFFAAWGADIIVKVKHGAKI